MTGPGYVSTRGSELEIKPVISLVHYPRLVSNFPSSGIIVPVYQFYEDNVPEYQ